MTSHSVAIGGDEEISLQSGIQDPFSHARFDLAPCAHPHTDALIHVLTHTLRH